jgi:SAM-dependent methyltransferase
VRGYDHRSYGDGFADVYDEWYADVTDVDATVSRVLGLAGSGGRVLELGVGTGRLAVPLAGAGLRVVGIDSSEAMLATRRDRDGGHRVDVVVGDITTDLPAGPFDVVLIAYNTIFNLLGEHDQPRLFRDVAARLAPAGAFVVEAFVPAPAAEDEPATSSEVSVRSMAVDHVVLSVSVNRRDEQLAEGQFVQFTEGGGVRLRPWSIRWATPAQLDEMATAAGLRLAERFDDMAGAPFTDDSARHVSVYRRPPARKMPGSSR